MERMSISQSETLRLLYRNQFASFLRFAFRQVHPVKRFLQNWHIDHLTGLITEIIEKRTTRAIINAPPRTLKSFITSIAYPVFALGQNPSLKIMVVAGNRKLAKELEHTARMLLSAPAMAAVFPGLKGLENRRPMQLGSGGQLTFGVYGKSVVGRGADIIIVDDPLSPSEANDDMLRAEANEWFKSDLLPRLTERSTGAILVVMQRLHPDDLTGMLLHGGDSWRHAAYPSVAAADEHWTLPNGEVSVRRKGEALHPAVLNREQLLGILHQIGAVQFSAQYQQNTSVRQEDRWGHWLGGHYDQAWYDNWTPEDGLERWFMGYVPEVWFLQYQLFGEGSPPPERYVAKLGEAKWQQVAILQQRRLLESMVEPE